MVGDYCKHPGLLTKTPELSINKMITRQEWKPWPHQTLFSGSYEHYKEEMSTHQPQCVSHFSLDFFLSLKVANTWGGQSIKRHKITGFLFCPLRQWSQIQLLQTPESAKQDLQTKHIYSVNKSVWFQRRVWSGTEYQAVNLQNWVYRGINYRFTTPFVPFGAGDT